MRELHGIPPVEPKYDRLFPLSIAPFSSCLHTNNLENAFITTFAKSAIFLPLSDYGMPRYPNVSQIPSSVGSNFLWILNGDEQHFWWFLIIILQLNILSHTLTDLNAIYSLIISIC